MDSQEIARQLARRADAEILNQLFEHLGNEVYQFELSKGWQPNDNTFGDSLALLHSEISEALDAFREIGFAERTRPVSDNPHPFKQGGTGCCAVCDDLPGEGEHALGKPDDVASELADVLIRLLSTWHQWMTPEGFRLGDEYRRKMAYNATRAWKHGGKTL